MDCVRQGALNFGIGCLSTTIGAFIQMPPFLNVARSILRKNTYREPVDLSEKGIQDLNASTGEADWNVATTQKVQGLFTSHRRGLEEIFCMPLSAEVETIERHNQTLKRLEFTPLAKKPNGEELIDYYSVAKTPDQALILKFTGTAFDDNSIAPDLAFAETFAYAYAHPKDSLLRLKMVKIINQAIKDNELRNISIPKKMAVTIPSSSDSKNPQYVIAAECLDILSFDETIAAIQDATVGEQFALADRIHAFIQATGFIDASIGYNLVFKRDDTRPLNEKEIVIIDTEPRGSLREAGKVPKFPVSSLEMSKLLGNFFAFSSAFKWVGEKAPFTKRLLELIHNQSVTPSIVQKTLHYINVYIPWAILAYTLNPLIKIPNRKRIFLLLAATYIAAILILPILKYLYIYTVSFRLQYHYIRFTFAKNSGQDEAKISSLKQKYINALGNFRHATNTSYSYGPMNFPIFG